MVPHSQGKQKEQKDFKGQMNENILTEKPNVRWDDISGLEGANSQFLEHQKRIYSIWIILVHHP